jgi:hypothetical protein
MFKKKPKNPAKNDIETEFIQITYQYIEEFFVFLKKIEPLLLIITLLIALYTLLSYQPIPEDVENIADRTLTSIASTIGMLYLGMLFYWVYILLYKKTICRRTYNFVIPFFLGIVGTILLGASTWIASIHTDSSTPPVITEFTVFFPLIFSIVICLYFLIKTSYQCQPYYLQMKLEEPTIKDKIKKYKGAIISGIISSSFIIIITSILIFSYQVLLYDTFIYYWPILIFGGILADILSKTENKGEAYLNGLLTVFYITVIYFFVVMVGIYLIYYKLWTHPTLYHEWHRIFEPAVVLFAYSCVIVLFGEYLSYIIRKIFKKLKGRIIKMIIAIVIFVVLLVSFLLFFKII